jgi:tRNA 5-methylaminomethyl-2-thiouridine biosynthesis bifunctional protein
MSGTPGPDGRATWIAGSTFERGATQAGLKPADQLANRDKLLRLLPALGAALAPAFEQAGAWAGLRCTLPDRVPAVGPLDAQAWPGLHVCAGMGARGLTLSVLCGELLAALLHGEPWPVERRLAQSLLASRFIQPTAGRPA